jgi:HlyD family secretion protein
MDQRQQMLTRLKEAIDNLSAAIAEWEKLYAIVTPIDGRVTFNKYWSANQYVAEGDVIFSIIPFETENVVARVKVPVSGAGKVKIGQQVQIRLENYPHTEFGMLEGTIESISMIPEESDDGYFYNAEITFPNGLTTNYKQKLPFAQQLHGQADIVTNSMSLFERFINPLKSAWKKSV